MFLFLFFFLAAFYYFSVLFSLSILLVSRSPQAPFFVFFLPIIIQIRARTALPPISLFSDWCVRKIRIVCEVCVVLGWDLDCPDLRGMIYPCENPRSNIQHANEPPGTAYGGSEHGTKLPLKLCGYSATHSQIPEYYGHDKNHTEHWQHQT